MNANVSSLLAGLVLTVATVPLHAQRVEAGVVVHSGPVAGHVIVRDGYSTYRRPVTRRVIVVDHGNGVRTRFGHLASLRVKTGQRVHKGQTIASMGSTGRSTGPHLHYEVRVDGVAANPRKFVLE